MISALQLDRHTYKLDAIPHSWFAAFYYEYLVCSSLGCTNT